MKRSGVDYRQVIDLAHHPLMRVPVEDESQLGACQQGHELDGTERFSIPGTAVSLGFPASSSGEGGLAVMLGGSPPLTIAGQPLAGTPSVSAIFRVDPDGSLRWAKSSGFGGIPQDAVSVDTHDYAIVAGRSTTPVDFGAGPLSPGNGSYLLKLAP